MRSTVLVLEAENLSSSFFSRGAKIPGGEKEKIRRRKKRETEREENREKEILSIQKNDEG